jgi:spectinomycin phosphotransferase
MDGLVRILALWGLREARLEYLPVGFGSHHWGARDGGGQRFFVTVDDLEAGFQAGDDADGAFAALERAYRTAAALRDDAGLEFVLAPVYDGEGAIIRRLDERYAVSMAPFVDGTTSSYGEYESDDERKRIGGLLGRLHAAGAGIPVGLPRRDDCSIPARTTLDEALASHDRPWNTGPFAEPTQALLADRADELDRRLRDYDALAARVRERSDSWVVTHGEPHRANVIVDTRGGLRLVDWDTTLVAPRERDLVMVLDERLTGWNEYIAVAGEVPLDYEALELYRRWWDLADIAVFLVLFRRPHEEDENTVASFEVLRRNVNG